METKKTLSTLGLSAESASALVDALSQDQETLTYKINTAGIDGYIHMPRREITKLIVERGASAVGDEADVLELLNQRLLLNMDLNAPISGNIWQKAPFESYWYGQNINLGHDLYTSGQQWKLERQQARQQRFEELLATKLSPECVKCALAEIVEMCSYYGCRDWSRPTKQHEMVEDVLRILDVAIKTLYVPAIIETGQTLEPSASIEGLPALDEVVKIREFFLAFPDLNQEMRTVAYYANIKRGSANGGSSARTNFENHVEKEKQVGYVQLGQESASNTGSTISATFVKKNSGFGGLNFFVKNLVADGLGAVKEDGNVKVVVSSDERIGRLIGTGGKRIREIKSVFGIKQQRLDVIVADTVAETGFTLVKDAAGDGRLIFGEMVYFVSPVDGCKLKLDKHEQVHDFSVYCLSLALQGNNDKATLALNEVLESHDKDNVSTWLKRLLLSKTDGLNHKTNATGTVYINSYIPYGG